MNSLRVSCFGTFILLLVATVLLMSPDAWAAPAVSAQNRNQTGHFLFDVGCEFDDTIPAPNILAPASKVEDRIESALPSYVLTVGAAPPQAPHKFLFLSFDVRSQVYELAYDVRLNLAFDLGLEWHQPEDVVLFVAVVVSGPLRLDYGRPIVSQNASL